jgi:hypothetical protein
MGEHVDQPDMGSDIGIQEWLEWPKLDLIFNGQCVDQPDMESNIGIQEWSEWPKLELILNG